MTDADLTRHIFIKDSADPRADVGFVFGTYHGWKESAAKAAELYRNGLVRKLVTTGARTEPSFEQSEAALIADELVRLGVDREDIVIEDRSTNTLENVTFGREAIEREIGWANVRSIVAIAKEFHSRRTLMTLKRHVPAEVELKLATYAPPYLDRVRPYNWHETAEGREKIVREAQKIEKYLAKGDLAEL